MAFTTYRRVCRGVKTDAARAAARFPRAWISRARGIRAHLRHPRTCIARPGSLQAGETLLCSARPAASACAIEIGKALGARVIACASSDEKLAVCQRARADATINYAAEIFASGIKSFTGDRGLTSSTTRSAGLQRAGVPLHRLARRLLVSASRGEIPNCAEPPRSSRALGVGVFWGDFARAAEGLAGSIAQLGLWFREGKLRPHVSKIFPLENSRR